MTAFIIIVTHRVQLILHCDDESFHHHISVSTDLGTALWAVILTLRKSNWTELDTKAGIFLLSNTDEAKFRSNRLLRHCSNSLLFQSQNAH